MQISHIIHAPPLPCLQIFTEGQTGLPLLHSDFSPALHLPPDSVDVLLYLEFCLASTSQWLCCYYYVSSLAGLRAWQVSGPGFWGPGCKRATGRPVLLTRSHVLKQHNATLLLITSIITVAGVLAQRWAHCSALGQVPMALGRGEVILGNAEQRVGRRPDQPGDAPPDGRLPQRPLLKPWKR